MSTALLKGPIYHFKFAKLAGAVKINASKKIYLVDPAVPEPEIPVAFATVIPLANYQNLYREGNTTERGTPIVEAWVEG